MRIRIRKKQGIIVGCSNNEGEIIRVGCRRQSREYTDKLGYTLQIADIYWIFVIL